MHQFVRLLRRELRERRVQLAGVHLGPSAMLGERGVLQRKLRQQPNCIGEGRVSFRVLQLFLSCIRGCSS